MSLQRDDRPERDLHCKECAAALSEMERINLFDTCVFCSNGHSTPIKPIWSFLIHRFYQIQIYNLKFKLRKKLKDDSRYTFIGHLSAMGLTAEQDLTPTRQRVLIKSLKKVV
jgi:hypothetical protein